MCLFKDAELNCVNTNILLILLLIQLLIGISTNLYLPAIGTAGLLREAVKGNNLVPAPPPKITATTEFERDCILLYLFIYFIGIER
jgi:hypothetical protein